ncbi:hypothetical protein ABTE95_19750, partial [Acinetobacter baumannii]
GHSFVAYQWLFEVFCGWLFSSGGLWLVGFVCCLFSGALYLFLLPKIWISKGVPTIVPYLVLPLVLSPHWFNVRPQLVSYVFLLAFI